MAHVLGEHRRRTTNTPKGVCSCSFAYIREQCSQMFVRVRLFVGQKAELDRLRLIVKLSLYRCCWIFSFQPLAELLALADRTELLPLPPIRTG
jgi:hypothetical protein